ncbi:MAG TPA: GAF domain-containing protein [Crinalium sp.]|jgi:GAF domain-containing protein
MTAYTLPSTLEAVFSEHTKPEALFEALLPALCEVLQSDRCFLHLRNPQTRMYKSICWKRKPEFPDVTTEGWEPEMEWELDDPMFAAALRTAPSIFVDDIETASPEVLNVEFEREYLGHRALVHAHIGRDGALWGILQPCVFNHPRVWTDFDRFVINQLTEKLFPIVRSYVQASGV